MNIFCCMCEDRRLLLGIPPAVGWSLDATPCGDGTIFTLHIDREKDIKILGGNPVRLHEQVIEIKDSARAYEDIVGPAEYVDMSNLAEDVCYFEVGRYLKDVEAFMGTTEKCDLSARISSRESEIKIDSTAFYKWSRILGYLEGRLGAVNVSAWFDHATVIEFTEEVLKLDAGNAFRRGIIERRCSDLIQTAVKELYGSTVCVKVVATEEEVV